MEGQPGGTWTIAPYMTLIGRPGDDGIGYNIGSTPEYPNVPDINFDELYTGITVTVPTLPGALKIGDYVRYYPDKDFYPNNWLEGDVTQNYEETPHVNIFVTKLSGYAGEILSGSTAWSIQLQGRPGSNGNNGNNGAGYDYSPIEPYQSDISFVGVGGVTTAGNGDPGAYKIGDYVRWSSGTDSETYLFGEIVSKEWNSVSILVDKISYGFDTVIDSSTGGKLSIAGREGPPPSNGYSGQFGIPNGGIVTFTDGLITNISFTGQ
jgi:hypothetical protein